jgi:murein DD-endopeptidase MepM/ murein hydrolase activator NlpD
MPLYDARPRPTAIGSISIVDRADKPTETIEATSGERRRFRRLEREARREARRREREARQRERTATASPAGTPTAPGTPSAAGRRLRCRFLRATAVGVAALLLVSILIPPFLIPVAGVTSSRFFIRNAPDSPRLFDFEHHTGLDIAAPTGTRVGASRSGRVVATGDDPAYGLYVDVRHLFGWVTRYAHLSRIDVREGRLVLRGAKVGEVGATGRVTGPHLHFELRIAGRAYPPGVFLLFHRLRRSIIAGF